VKEKIKHYLAYLVFWGYRNGILKNTIKVKTIEETIDRLLVSNDSLVRFGDGEIKLISGKDLNFQKADDVLSGRLQNILQTKQVGLLVALPEIFEDVSAYVEKTQNFWMEHLLFHRKEYERYCRTDRIYESAFFSRPYIMYQDRRRCPELFAKIRKLWEKKNVVIVEGASSHNGVDSDLFDNVSSLKRIICPASQAWQSYEKILEACSAQPRDALILIALGPAGKVLAQDLFENGYRVLDIGNLDMEYCWYCMNAEKKTELKKHTLLTRQDNEKAGYYDYLSQIITIID